MSVTNTQQSRYRGEAVYIYAFDVAYEMKRQPLRTIMGHPVTEFAVDVSKRTPRAPFFYRSQTVRLPEIERMSPLGIIRMTRAIKVFPVGAISITVRVAFDVENLEELVPYHELRFTDGLSLNDIVRQLAEEVCNELREHLIKATPTLCDEEAYTVFCIDAPLRTVDGTLLSGEEWLHQNRRTIAALLTEESRPEDLSDQEADESTGRYLSYYFRDIVVLDWDAALIVDEPKYRDETIYVMELANLQLAELEAYDRLLDASVEATYRDLTARQIRRYFRAGPQKQLQELRIDMARITDELSNITKFFGDWHLARIYQHLSSRFHLADWHATVEEKLKTLDEIYQILRAEQNNRWMLILEATIVLLFIADLVMLFVK